MFWLEEVLLFCPVYFVFSSCGTPPEWADSSFNSKTEPFRKQKTTHIVSWYCLGYHPYKNTHAFKGKALFLPPFQFFPNSIHNKIEVLLFRSAKMSRKPQIFIKGITDFDRKLFLNWILNSWEMLGLKISSDLSKLIFCPEVSWYLLSEYPY